MTEPVRLRLSRVKGWNLQAASIALNGLPAVNIARPGRWGNPFHIGGFHKIGPKRFVGFSRLTCLDPKLADASYTRVETQEQAVEMFAKYHAIWSNPRDFSELRGKNLACWCRLSQVCHGDVLLELAKAAP